MPEPTTPMKTPMSCHLRTRLRMITSGSERAMTLIVKASTVPSHAPFCIGAWTIEMMPAARLTTVELLGVFAAHLPDGIRKEYWLRAPA